MKYQPIFLIGAARSGTKILRDTIATNSEIEKIEYDINFIWKRFNEDIDHDELEVRDVKPQFKRFIFKYFNKKAKNKPFLIEKTVGNSLRIPFLLEIFPNAKFIILYRDGRDVVESVVRQWGEAPSNSYLFKKLFSIPIFQVFPFLLTYAYDTLKIKLGLVPSKKYLWGVQYKGCWNDLDKFTALEFCTKQWNQCTESIIKHRAKIKVENRLDIYYENLVKNPKNEFFRIADFLNLNEEDFDYSTLKSSNIGKSKNKLSNKDYEELNNRLKSTLIKLGYIK
ncbi:sulfotransferase family protein [Aequorivita marisscotiae]|uniref:Sulfotransferase n=1 Tax=Aequorivita marisscotiae TaxID=3040348 RepID=A0ABY8KT27_9FLAO|nr:sulfotransferase [Aequorivita sp. Ant34-E75]WGF92203.1 sulfotransferase [Aequorivita sp. Ant34-E75]